MWGEWPGRRGPYGITSFAAMPGLDGRGAASAAAPQHPPAAG
jgi:hypothetical protein